MNTSEARKIKAIEAIRAVATDITTEDVTRGKLVKLETGNLTGTIAGQKVHKLRYTIRYWDDGSDDLFVKPECGTIRSAHGTGGHYQNYYTNLGKPVDCAKCQAR